MDRRVDEGRRTTRHVLRMGTALAALHAAASAAQTIPPGTPLSTVDQAIPSREEVTPPAPTRAPKGPSVSVDSRGAIAEADCPFETSPVRLKLTRIDLTRPDGSPLQPEIARALEGLSRPLGDQPVRIICSIRDEANALLAAGGWIAAVQAPQQTIANGVLRLNVVTTRIVEIRVRGEAGPYRALLERRLAELRALDPVNQRRAERLLLIAGDSPGLDIQLSLRPAGTAPGAVIGEVAVTFRRFAVTTAIQNLNAKTLGRTSVYSRAELYGLTGMSDLTYIGVSTTTDVREQRVVQGGHLLGVGAGATAGGRVTYAWSRPDLGALDLRTGTLIGGVDVVAPLIRSVNVNLRGALGFDYIDQRTTVRSGGMATVLNLDRTRTVFGRFSGDLIGRGGGRLPDTSLSAGLEVRQGLAAFGATRPGRAGAGVLPSRIGGDARATVLRADMDAVVGTGAMLSVLASLRAQWADRPLLAYDEFSIGNLTIGRGYDPGSNSGDRAVGMRVEVRFNPPPWRSLTPQLFAFTDATYLTNLDIGASERDRRLRSVGAGVRMLVSNRIAAEVSYARPLDRALLINGSPPPERLLFSLIFQARGKTQR